MQKIVNRAKLSPHEDMYFYLLYNTCETENPKCSIKLSIFFMYNILQWSILKDLADHVLRIIQKSATTVGFYRMLMLSFTQIPCFMQEKKESRLRI